MIYTMTEDFKMATTKDDRWAKQFGDCAEGLVMYVLGQLKNMSVALIDHVGADVIATDRNNINKRYAISVKGRNFPKSESKSFNFSQGNIDKLVDTATNFGMESAVAFVFVDEQEDDKKIRIFTMTLETLQNLCEDDTAEFVQYANDGITFKYTEGKTKHHLSEIKKYKCIDYTELVFSCLSDKLSFLE
jgi:hypothetical protein